MIIIAVLLTFAAVLLGYFIIQDWSAWGRRQVRAGARERARYAAKKPRAVRLYCPTCGCRADMRASSSFSKHDSIHQPWCPGCKCWIKSPVRVNQIEGGTE
jgi:hypothetical protein